MNWAFSIIINHSYGTIYKGMNISFTVVLFGSGKVVFLAFLCKLVVSWVSRDFAFVCKIVL